MYIRYTFVIFIFNYFPCLCNCVYFIAHRASAGFLSSNLRHFKTVFKACNECHRSGMGQCLLYGNIFNCKMAVKSIEDTDKGFHKKIKYICIYGSFNCDDFG